MLLLMKDFNYVNCVNYIDNFKDFCISELYRKMREKEFKIKTVDIYLF